MMLKQMVYGHRREGKVLIQAVIQRSSRQGVGAGSGNGSARLRTMAIKIRQKGQEHTNMWLSARIWRMAAALFGHDGDGRYEGYFMDPLDGGGIAADIPGGMRTAGGTAETVGNRGYHARVVRKQRNPLVGSTGRAKPQCGRCRNGVTGLRESSVPEGHDAIQDRDRAS
jgi:hypothetical protein